MKQSLTSKAKAMRLKFALPVALLFCSNIFFASFTLPELTPPVLMTLEEYETETTGSQAFSEGGISFTSTSGLFIEFSNGFGANSSSKWLGTVAGNGGSSGNVGSIQIQTASTSFTVTNFAAWTSNNDGTTRATGNVTFTGTLAAGGTAMETVTIAPTADDGTGYVTVTFTGALAGAALTAMSVTLPGNLNYIAIDNFNFTTAPIVTNQYSINDVPLLEGNGSGTTSFTFNVSRTNNSAVGSVQYQTANNTATAPSDYTALSLTTLNFAIGESSKMVTVLVNKDATVESNESFFVNLSNATGGTILDPQGVGTILDDDEICESYEDETDAAKTFSQNSIAFNVVGDLEIEEANNFGAGGSDFYLGTVPSNGGTSGSAGTISIATAATSFIMSKLDAWTSNDDGNAAASGMVTFTGTLSAGGTVTHTSTVSPVGLNYVTVNFAGSPLAGQQLSSLQVTLGAGLNYIAIDNFCFGTAAITAPQVSVSDVSVLEGNSGNTAFNFTITRTNNTSAFSVNWATSNGTATAGSDYTAVPSTMINFTNGGSLTQTIIVNVSGDAAPEANETFNVNLSSPTGGALILDGLGIGTILDDDSVCENYEGETTGGTTFSQNSIAFNATNALKVEFSNGFGSGSSSYWLGTVAGNGGNSGSVGKIVATTANTAFRIYQIDAWTSNNDGSVHASGNVTFTGTLFGGGTVTTTILVTPTASNGTGWDNLSFVGTPLENQNLTELEIILGAGLNYIGLDNFCFTAVSTAPEMDVLGNSMAIDDGGGNSPAAGNHTAFGTVCETGTISRTFTIQNNGLSNLSLSGSPIVQLGGTGASHFSVTTPPPATITPGNASTFTILFDPTEPGTHNATVNITNNDLSENPYNFNISGVADEEATAEAGPIQTICAGATATMAGSIGGSASSLTWTTSGTGTFDNANLANAVYTPSTQDRTNGSVVLTITTNDPAGLCPAASDNMTLTISNSDVNISVSPASTSENGAGNLVYTIQRNCTLNAVTINFSVGGTATFNTDYGQSGATTFNAASGTVTMGVGVPSVIITVDPSGDSDYEPNETVILTITGGTGYTVGTNSAATGTINNDDSPMIINEVDGDTPGTDALEFIELYDGGLGNFSLDGLVLVFYNGANDQSYLAIDLDGFTTNAGGYFTAGNAGVTGVDAIFAGNVLQNGQDAVALYLGNATDFPNGTIATTNGLIDALVYDTDDPDDPGLLVLHNAGQPQINENGSANAACHSMQRIPNGSGGQRNTSSYALFAPTPDAANGAPLVNISVAPSPVVEDGGSNLVYTITRTGSTICDMTVNFTISGTASNGGDYANISASAIILASNSSTTVTVDPTPDVVVETNETVILTLTDGAEYDLGANTAATGTINNDDIATVTLSGGMAKDEGNSGTTAYDFFATLDNPVQGGFTVSYNTNDGTATVAGGDYNDNDGTLTFSGSLNEMLPIKVNVNGDMMVEPNEQFTVSLGTPSVANVSVSGSPQTGTINNDDSAIVTLTGGGSANEGNSGTNSRTFTATLNNPVQGGFTVSYSTNDGTATTADGDFQDNDGTLTFTGTAGEPKTITVIVNGDTKLEGDETFTVSLGVPSNASVSTSGSPQTGTIQNDDAVTVTLSGGAAKDEGNAGNTVYTFKATLNNPVQGGFNIAYNTNDGSATLANNDYQDNDGTLTFVGSANEMHDINVNVVGDFNVEPDETFTVSLGAIGSTPWSGSISVSGSPQTGTILNDDSAVVTLSGGTAKNEGNSGTTAYTFIATLNNGVQGGFNLAYNTNNGTASTADNDYQDNDGTLTFTGSPNEMKTVTVNVNGDTKVEMDETFTVALGAFSNTPLGASLATAGSPQTGTITNDDMATVTLSGGMAKNEGNAGMVAYTFTATLDQEVMGGFTLPYNTNNGTATTADNDYQDNDGLLSFTGTANEMKTITVLVNGDTKVELTETFTVALGAPSVSNVAVADSPQTGTINNDDQATISINNVTMTEGNAGTQTFNFTVTLDLEVDNPVSVNFATADNTAVDMGTGAGSNDYDGNSGMLNFSGMATNDSKQISVTVNGDNVVELTETFFVNLSNIQAGLRNVIFADDQGLGTITNDDQCVISFIAAPIAVPEGNSGTSPYPLTINKSNPVDVSFVIAFVHSDGTATLADNDYVNAVGNTSVGSLSGSIVTIGNPPIIIGDTKVEPDEFFNVTISENDFMGRNIIFTGGAASLTKNVNILNDDIDWSDAPDTYQTLSASGGPSHAGSNLKLGTTNDGEANGQPSADASGDGAEDDGVSFTATIIAGTNATVSVTSSGTGFLDAWMDFNGNNNFGDAGEKIFSSQAVVAGVNNLSYAVPGAATQGTSFARFRLSSTGGLGIGGAASDGEVEDYQVEIISTMFSIDDPMVMEGNVSTANLMFTVSRTNTANASSVNYAITGGTATTADGDYTPLAAGTLNFTAGGSPTQNIIVQVNGDLKVELDETVIITLSNPVNGTITDDTGIGTIKNDDAATISVSSPSVIEGDIGSNPTLTFNITMSNPSDANVTFNYSTVPGTATGNVDYQNASGSHTLTPGQTTKTVMVTVNGDCIIEPDEMFTLQLSALMNNGRNVTFASGQSTQNGTGTILNDDALPALTCPASFSQNTDSGLCSATVTLPLPMASSVCGTGIYEFRYRTVNVANIPIGAFSVWIPSVNNTQVFAKGKYEIEWRVTDGSGSTSCSFYLEILDNEAPVALCKNITVPLDANGNVTITPSQIDNGSSDNCSFTLGLDVTTFNCSNTTTVNMVTLTATDPSNNMHSCMATVTVEDVTPPTILCMNATVYLDANGQVTITHATIFAGSSDNCGFIGLEPLAQTLFTCANIGPNTVTLNAFDSSNNTSSCSATLTVVDNIPPTLACQDITVSLTANGNLTIMPSEVYDAANSSDNCGMVNLVSVSPNFFTCQDEGANTVTLTANDGHGNISTCTATVTINDFLTITSITATDVSCIGAGDGTVTITATAGGGQIGYSVDGGINFNFTGIYTNLTAGTYSIVVKVFGVPAVCVKTATVTILLAPNGAGSTWYKDWDNDGYSDGVTHQGCVQPTGYKLLADLIAPPVGSNIDCNDFDEDEFPGQVWYKDWDGDGYSDGTSQVACMRPVNYKHAGELQIGTDCNDTNSTINPGATEVCNGIDDNCNGQIDEGIGNMTYNGNVTFTTQAQVDAWSLCYTVINGHLTIKNAGIVDLTPLLNIIEVTGNVLIMQTGLTSLNGLNNLAEIGGNLVVRQNTQLVTLDGLEAVLSVGNLLQVFQNLNLTDCCAIYDLLNNNGVGGTISIFSNDTGCDNVSEIYTSCAGNNNLVGPGNNNDCEDCGVVSTSALSFDLSPNPASEEVYIRLKNHDGSQGEVVVYNALGQPIVRQVLLEKQYGFVLKIGSSDFVSGEFVVQVKTGKGRAAEKLIVIK